MTAPYGLDGYMAIALVGSDTGIQYFKTQLKILFINIAILEECTIIYTISILKRIDCFMVVAIIILFHYTKHFLLS